jgi:hypothetical protein
MSGAQRHGLGPSHPVAGGHVGQAARLPLGDGGRARERNVDLQRPLHDSLSLGRVDREAVAQFGRLILVIDEGQAPALAAVEVIQVRPGKRGYPFRSDDRVEVAVRLGAVRLEVIGVCIGPVRAHGTRNKSHDAQKQHPVLCNSDRSHRSRQIRHLLRGCKKAPGAAKAPAPEPRGISCVPSSPLATDRPGTPSAELRAMPLNASSVLKTSPQFHGTVVGCIRALWTSLMWLWFPRDPHARFDFASFLAGCSAGSRVFRSAAMPFPSHARVVRSPQSVVGYPRFPRMRRW